MCRRACVYRACMMDFASTPLECVWKKWVSWTIVQFSLVPKSEIKNGEKPKVGISSSAFYFTGKILPKSERKIRIWKWSDFGEFLHQISICGFLCLAINMPHKLQKNLAAAAIKLDNPIQVPNLKPYLPPSFMPNLQTVSTDKSGWWYWKLQTFLKILVYKSLGFPEAIGLSTLYQDLTDQSWALQRQQFASI
jgi:hypothetical protein